MISHAIGISAVRDAESGRDPCHNRIWAQFFSAVEKDRAQKGVEDRRPRISTLALIRNPRRDEALPPGRQPHPSARLRSWLIRPLVRLCAHDAAAVVDGATRDQPELGQLASSRATSIAQARKALGPAFDTAAEHGATMTDDELVAYLDEVITQIATRPADPR